MMPFCRHRSSVFSKSRFLWAYAVADTVPEPAAVVCRCPGPSALMIAKSRAALVPEGNSSVPVDGHAGIRISAGRLWLGSVDPLGLLSRPSGSLSGHILPFLACWK